MSILLVSDLHYDLRQFDWVLERADRHDLVVIAGDLLDIASLVPVQAQIAAVSAFLRDLAARSTVAACSGNHDLDRRRDDGEKETRWLLDLDIDGLHVDGTDFRFGELLVSVLAWWEGDRTRALIERQLAAAEPADSSRWLWIYHSPPEGALSWTGARHFGDGIGAEWIDRYQPGFVLCGHIHQSPFTDVGSWCERRGRTWVFNAGRERSDAPVHVEIDLEAGEASWVSREHREQVALA
jgi:Icc-related predicted phosphoesterase